MNYHQEWTEHGASSNVKGTCIVHWALCVVFPRVVSAFGDGYSQLHNGLEENFVLGLRKKKWTKWTFFFFSAVWDFFSTVDWSGTRGLGNTSPPSLLKSGLAPSMSKTYFSSFSLNIISIFSTNSPKRVFQDKKYPTQSTIIFFSFEGSYFPKDASPINKKWRVLKIMQRFMYSP